MYKLYSKKKCFNIYIYIDINNKLKYNFNPNSPLNFLQWEKKISYIKKKKEKRKKYLKCLKSLSY